MSVLDKNSIGVYRHAARPLTASFSADPPLIYLSAFPANGAIRKQERVSGKTPTFGGDRGGDV